MCVVKNKKMSEEGRGGEGFGEGGEGLGWGTAKGEGGRGIC